MNEKVGFAIQPFGQRIEAIPRIVNKRDYIDLYIANEIENFVGTRSQHKAKEHELEGQARNMYHLLNNERFEKVQVIVDEFLLKLQTAFELDDILHKKLYGHITEVNGWFFLTEELDLHKFFQAYSDAYDILFLYDQYLTQAGKLKEAF